ncbi:MAG: class I tRNA ligase family protein, partial [Stellaceae bacterium]
DWYLEFTKPILQGGDAAAQAETRAATAWVLGQVVHLLHPIMPFLTEEVWRQLAGGAAGMLMTAAWPEPQFADAAALAEMEWAVAAISAIRGVRSEMNVPPGARVPLFVRDADAAATARLAAHCEHFQRLARVEPQPGEPAAAGGIQVVVEGATFILALGDVVDLSREKARLTKEIGRLDGDLAKFAAKLANPAFLERAKPEVVEEQRERAADLRRDRDRLHAAYQRLEMV